MTAKSHRVCPTYVSDGDDDIEFETESSEDSGEEEDSDIEYLGMISGFIVYCMSVLSLINQTQSCTYRCLPMLRGCGGAQFGK